MNKERDEKFWQTYTLLGELLLQYPESMDEVYTFLINAKEFYKENRDYETQKSIEREYVVFETESRK